VEEARSRTRQVEEVFRRIAETRMDGVPILNPALAVQAVAVERWEQSIILGLVTPWFINVMLLPGTGECAEWEGMAVGQSTVQELPGGRFSFIAASEEGIGPYRMCSLFSPVLEFADQETACAAAAAALHEMLRAEVSPQPALSRRDLFLRSMPPKGEVA
jgi:[NiFe] hydrogenase assembly HybE family chaperone